MDGKLLRQIEAFCNSSVSVANIMPDADADADAKRLAAREALPKSNGNSSANDDNDDDDDDDIFDNAGEYIPPQPK